MCNNEISQDELKERVNSYAKADKEKLQSLAEMLLLCAEALSSGSEDYHDILRRRAEQQEVIAGIIEELRQKYPENGMKPGYPLEKERMLIAALRRGDSAEAKKLLNELLALLIFSNPGHFKYVQIRVTELVVLLSRVELSPEKSGNTAMETNSRNLKQVQESKTIEELTDILHTIVDRVSGIISSFHGIPHAVALRKAESFILENYTRKISLKEIAAVAGLSPPYFSTIFKEEMGENLSKYLNRLRVEKASRLLLETTMSLSEIAGCCCFEDQSWFSKIFKAYTGISPGKYRNQGGGTVQHIGENNLSEAFLKTLN
jgi:YesN/AraC family two-component response regulator